MLRSLPGWKFYEWKAFYELEPDASVRNDWGLARIAQALAGNGKPLGEFMLPFGDWPAVEPVQQSLDFQETVIDAWIFGNNEAIRAKERGIQ